MKWYAVPNSDDDDDDDDDDPSTIYTVMKNFVSVCLWEQFVNQLEQEYLSMFCDEGVYRILLGSYLKRPEDFQNIILMMRSFHMTKCVRHCIGKYIKGSRL